MDTAQFLPTGVVEEVESRRAAGPGSPLLHAGQSVSVRLSGQGELLGRPCSQGLLGQWSGCVQSPDARSSEVSTPEASATVSPLSP